MAVIGVLNSLLPVLDDVDAARQHGDLADGPFAAIAAKLENALKTYGLVRIDETGVEFDPTIHEALIQQPGEDSNSTPSARSCAPATSPATGSSARHRLLWRFRPSVTSTALRG